MIYKWTHLRINHTLSPVSPLLSARMLDTFRVSRLTSTLWTVGLPLNRHFLRAHSITRTYFPLKILPVILNILRWGSFEFQAQPFVNSSSVMFTRRVLLESKTENICPVMCQWRRGIRDWCAMAIRLMFDTVASNDICKSVTKLQFNIFLFSIGHCLTA